MRKHKDDPKAKLHNVAFKVEKEVWDKLREVAQQEDRTVSAVIRMRLREALNLVGLGKLP